jgi:hypothetical protein
MKRWIALAVGALAVVVYAAVPVAAASGAPAAGPNNVSAATVSPPATSPAAPPSNALDVAFSEQPGGSGLSVTLDAGATEQHDLVVANHTPDLRLTVKLTATDATGSITAGTSSWIAFGSDAVEIDPNSAQTIPVTISVPHDTQPGEALAHVVAAVSSAALAADGSPRSVSLSKTLPISIAVNGSPTAQIAITNVQRIDKGSKHELGLVMRNFGDQGTRVSGQIRVGGTIPQTLSFGAELAPRRDTTLLVDWAAPPKNVAVDIDVEANYGGGNTASWSSEVGGPPTTIATQPPSDAYTTPTSVGDATTATNADTTTTTSSSGSAAKPWWKRDAIPLGVVVAISLAVLWFAFELVSSRRRRHAAPAGPPFLVMPSGWAHPGTPGTLGDQDGSVELARQLLLLSQAIVRLASGLPALDDDKQQPQPVQPQPTQPDRVRSPAADPPPAAAAPGAHVDEKAPAQEAPAPVQEAPRVDVRTAPTTPPPAEPVRDKQKRRPKLTRRKPTRAASSTPDVEARPEVAPTPASTQKLTPTRQRQPQASPQPSPPPPQPKPSAPKGPSPDLVNRLLALDRERRQLKDWMDVTDEGSLAWPSDEEVRRFQNQRDDRTRDS